MLPTEAFDEKFYLFFRKSCLALQKRFTELYDVSRMPRVFLHGNPHVDNFAKINAGEAMIDFDRSRVGPYAWDLIRLCTSVALRQEHRTKKLLTKKVLAALMDGYDTGLKNPYSPVPVPEILASIPNDTEKNTSSYLDANLKWAEKMRKRPVFISHPSIQSLVNLYFDSRNEKGNAEKFVIEEAGFASGSLGKPRILMVLSEKDAVEPDRILLEIKEVYDDPDTEYFFNPYVHHGLRMIEASHIYAPHFEKGLGYLTWRNKQYWARQIPSFKAKITGNMSESLQEKFMYTMGVQLGKGHAKSLREILPHQLFEHVNGALPELTQVCLKMNEELTLAWQQRNTELIPAENAFDSV